MPVLETREPVALEAVLRGGQSFRWRPHPSGDGLVGVARGHRFHLRGHPDGLAWTSDPPGAGDLLASYLHVDPSYPEAVARLADDPLVAWAVEAHRGLRVLRQDPWEATAAFLLSSNNNVARIEGLVEDLARAAGERRTTPDGDAWWAFPEPGAVADLGEAALRDLGCGYRAPYLRESARMVADGDVPLEALADRPVEAARRELMRLPGVGDKVADCVLLFGLGAGEAFPVDRWVARWIAEAGPDVDPGDPADVRAFARARWGADAGLAQQFLFHGTREDGALRGAEVEAAGFP